MDIMIYRLSLFCVVNIFTTRLIFGSPVVSEMNFDVTVENNISQTYEVCQSEDCKRAADRILSAMNKSAEPCEDFYELVCGNWTIPPDLPKDEIQRSQISLTVQKISAELRDILEEELKSDDDELLRKLKLVYRSCMNLDERDNAGVIPIVNYLNAIGGWPMTMANGTWKNRTWQEVDNYFLGLDSHSAFFHIKFMIDYQNASLLVPFLKPTTAFPLGISMAKYANASDPNNPHVKIISELAWIIAEATGTNVSRESITKEAIEMYNFQKALSKALSPLRLKKKDRGIEFWTLEELEGLNYNESDENSVTNETSEFEEYSEINIDFFGAFESLFNSTEITLSKKQRIGVENLRSFEKLTELLNKTPNRVIVNYIHYNFVVRMMKYANRQLLNINAQTYDYNTLDFLKSLPQWKQCLEQMDMKEGLSYYYVQKYFPDEYLPLLNETVENVRNAVVGRILRSEWLDDDTKELIKKKLVSTEKLLGYPDHLKNLTHVTKLYDDVLVGPNYIETVLSQQKSSLKKSLMLSQRLRERRTWLHYNAYDVNAYNLRVGNVIIVPAGILQDPYFVPSLPSVLLYGSLGFIIGHEFSHSLDTLGRNYDGNGTFAEWWPEEVVATYEEKSQCFIEQYNNYTLDLPSNPAKTMKLNGKQLQNENIADSASIKATFDAYRTKLQQDGQRLKKLPGFEEYNDDQIFFISFGHTWCDALLPNFVQTVAENGKHSPARARINGALSNVQEFSETFKCPVGSTLNPEDKCSLW